MFSVKKAREAGGGELLDKGWYPCEILNAEWNEAESGTESLKLRLKFNDDGTDVIQTQYINWRTMRGDDIPFLQLRIVAIAEAVGAVRNDEVEARDMLGKRFEAKLDVREFNGRKSNEIVEAKPIQGGGRGRRHDDVPADRDRYDEENRRDAERDRRDRDDRDRRDRRDDRRERYEDDPTF